MDFASAGSHTGRPEAWRRYLSLAGFNLPSGSSFFPDIWVYGAESFYNDPMPAELTTGHLCDGCIDIRLTI